MLIDHEERNTATYSDTKMRQGLDMSCFHQLLVSQFLKGLAIIACYRVFTLQKGRNSLIFP